MRIIAFIQIMQAFLEMALPVLRELRRIHRCRRCNNDDLKGAINKAMQERDTSELEQVFKGKIGGANVNQ